MADDSPQDAFIPKNKKVEREKGTKTDYEPVNLATDEDLVKKVLPFIQTYYEKYDRERDEIEDIWDAANWMLKCGQYESTRETERARTDRNSSENQTKTKTQQVGSTMFHRNVKQLASILNEVLTAKRDPFRFKPIYNKKVFHSGEEAEDQAVQHNLLLRWSREHDDFSTKVIGLFWDLCTYGNVPIYVSWRKRGAEILDRWNKGQKKPTRKFILTDNRPDWDWVPNELFYADQNIADLQKQNCIITKCLENVSTMRGMERTGEYVNTDKIEKKHLYQGGDEDITNIREDKERNETYASTTSDDYTGTTLEFDAHCLLPIDESKPEGSRWDPENHEPKKYWVTVATQAKPEDGVCIRLERNPDPDDEYPFFMLSLFPIEKNKLYKLSPAQVIRGNYTESTTSKQQALDARTFNNNRPLMVKQGEVRMQDGSEEFTAGPDKVYEVNSMDDVKLFDQIQIQDNMNTLGYLDNDSDQALGITQVVQGTPMGGRTSSNEAEKAHRAGNRPHVMMARYVLHGLLRFYARKYIRYWHVFSTGDMILQITDDEKHPVIHPADLYGQFDIELTIVDDYIETVMQRENFSYAAQNIIPVFAPVLNLHEMGRKALSSILNWDDPELIKQDRGDLDEAKARAENKTMLEEGQYVEPQPDEDHEAMLRVHKSEELLWRPVEKDPNAARKYVQVANLPLLRQHIAETEILRQQVQPASLPAGTPAQPPENTTEGMAAGNQIAGELGAQEAATR